MEYKIEEKPSFDVVGKAIRVATGDGEHMRDIPDFWTQCREDGTNEHLRAIAAKGKTYANALFGVCVDFTDDMSGFTYMIAAEGSDPGNEHDLLPKSIPATTWAVFPGSGPMPDAIQSLWQRIFSEFFPAGEYEMAPGPNVEIYPQDTVEVGHDFEVWIPIKKK